jgi:two-component system nitrate/nitrite response regulator NarL
LRVLLVDDHALMRKALEELLHSRGVQVVASVGTGEEGIREAQHLPPDVILLDVKMPGMSGIETLEKLRATGVTAPVVMLTMSRDDNDLRAALRAGATGYLLKDMDPEDLLPALETARHGYKVVPKDMDNPPPPTGPLEPPGPPPAPTPFPELTPRELEILLHVAEGQSNKTIARELNITDGTVKLHVKSILRKFGMHSRVELAVWVVKHGLGRKDRKS